MPATTRFRALRLRRVWTVRPNVRATASAWPGRRRQHVAHRSSSLGSGPGDHGPGAARARPAGSECRPPDRAHRPPRRWRTTRPAPKRGVGGIGGQIEEGGQHLGSRHPVDDGVVHLGHQSRYGRPPAPRPRGTPTAADGGRAGVRPGRPPAPPAPPPPGAREAGPAHVVVEVEIGIVDQRRVLEPEGTSTIRMPERGHQVHPLGHQRPDPAEARRHRAPRSGSKTIAPMMWRWVVGDSRARNAPSRPVRRAIPYRPVDPKPPRPRSALDQLVHLDEVGRLDPLDDQLGDPVTPLHP